MSYFSYFTLLAIGIVISPLRSEELIIIGNDRSACFWLTDDKGSSPIKYSLPGGDPGYVYGVVASNTTAYIVGQNDNENAALWIVGSDGSLPLSPIVIEDKTSYASAVALSSTKIYIGGSYVPVSPTLGVVWITDLTGRLLKTINLPDVALNYATNVSALAVSENRLYVAGARYFSDTASPAMWIYDLEGNFIDSLDLEPGYVGVPSGIAVSSSNVYVVGGFREYQSSITIPQLFITDLEGAGLQRILLTGDNYHNPNGIALSETNAYVAGYYYQDPSPTLPICWKTDFLGQNQIVSTLSCVGTNGGANGVALTSKNAYYVGSYDATFGALWIVGLEQPYTQNIIQIDENSYCLGLAFFSGSGTNQKQASEMFQQITPNRPGKHL